ncbi:MAG: MBL fold metallo-hydrolase [Thermoanaerobaculia bacterium]|nr:MBL fold metallo-hydrolase [Thermoanaerobaculia bacterium]
MKLVFLGTRGKIEPESDRHRMHTSLLVSYYGRRVMIDCGETWEGEIDSVAPHALVVTHSHPDHVGGLKNGAPCPVWATAESWEVLEDFEIEEGHEVQPREPFQVEGIDFEAFPVLHSIKAPAVGYRIRAGRVTIFYVPDVLYIEERADALADCRLYIGDGATIDGNLVRRSNDQLIGHTTVRTQLTWCRKEGVPEMIVTHCGSQIVKGELEDPETIREKVEGYARERDVEVQIAYDGMERVLR